MHDTTLLFTVAISLALAFVGGFVALKLRLSPIVGYLLVGALIGPHTPGFVADLALASQLSEIGVILLMFGVGMHFSVGDLLAVRNIALPGAILQILVATAMGMGLAHLWGWSLGGGVVLGLALSVASTVVLLRALEEQGELSSENGNIAVGWLIVEDIVMVLVLVLLPALSGWLGGQAGPTAGQNIIWTLGLTLGKVSLFVGFMLVIGRKLFPWLLNKVAATGSRELFTLFVIGVALGVAYGSAALFGVSFALGAFFAGVVIHESHLSHRAAANALPLQDAFAVLFFVSVGMLFDPKILWTHPFQVLAVVSIIIIGKSLAAFGLILALRYPLNTALKVSASLAQIGEFSFILAGLGASLGLLPPSGQSLILAGALISITLNPFIFHLTDFLKARLKNNPLLAKLNLRDSTSGAGLAGATLSGHVILVGFGRVGRVMGRLLGENKIPFVVIEQNRNTVEELQAKGIPAIYGDAESSEILHQVGLPQARYFVVTPLDSFQVRQLVQSARTINPAAQIMVRTHSDSERQFLESLEGKITIVGDVELGLTMTRHILQNYEQKTVAS
ncbi:YbaL family putative K(+) efflux transporter [Vampirovibrio sp.]|uniref:YbaL family putative K(+) efflux transporter n=1 Tax=Vampirovibrio sp. TaxID=2717857 RepID=UPI003593EEAB